jgi:hypothetical protein
MNISKSTAFLPALTDGGSSGFPPLKLGALELTAQLSLPMSKQLGSNGELFFC